MSDVERLWRSLLPLVYGSYGFGSPDADILIVDEVSQQENVQNDDDDDNATIVISDDDD